VGVGVGVGVGVMAALGAGVGVAVPPGAGVAVACAVAVVLAAGVGVGLAPGAGPPGALPLPLQAASSKHVASATAEIRIQRTSHMKCSSRLEPIAIEVRVALGEEGGSMIVSAPIRALSCVLALATTLSLLDVRPAGAQPTTHDQLQALARSMTFDWAKRHPLEATDLGLSDEDGQLDTPGGAENARDLATITRWERDLDAIAVAGAPLADADDAKLLRARLIRRERELTTYKTFEKDYAAPAESLVDAVFTQFQHLPVAGTGGATSADVARAWDNIVARLSGAPAYIAAGDALVVHPGHLYGTVGAQELAGVPDFLNGALTDAAKSQLPADRFAAFAAARDGAVAAVVRAKGYIDAHVASWPENFAIGRRTYDAMLRDEELLPYDATDIEGMANDELARGWAEQSWVVADAAERGTPIGPASGGGIAPSGDALIGYYRDRIAELRAFVRDHHVVDVPDWLGQIEVTETPSFLQPVSPGASMRAPLLFSKSTTGFYFITPPASLADAAKTLDPNEDFDKDRILQTAAHEAMPGHFLQLSIAHRNPDFVRKTESTGVFAEGWAFYGEEMFWQLGLYGDQDLDARYDAAQWERVRGARAIVDPELASGDWTYEHAVAFFAAQTGFPMHAARAAVAGIALGPGYVISYTVGRLQLETLLGDYMAKMGANGSLLDFHDRLLCYGTTPFAVVAPELIADLDKPLAVVRASAGY
jgi:hypothetical protein